MPRKTIHIIYQISLKINCIWFDLMNCKEFLRHPLGPSWQYCILYLTMFSLHIKYCPKFPPTARVWWWGKWRWWWWRWWWWRWWWITWPSSCSRLWQNCGLSSILKIILFPIFSVISCLSYYRDNGVWHWDPWVLIWWYFILYTMVSLILGNLITFH